MTVPERIEMVEVSARDGLQNEAIILSTADKVELIGRAIQAGSRRIEVASFVRPDRVPQMADAEMLCEALPDRTDVTYVGLALNLRGLQRALATKIDEVGAVACASDGFAKANQGRSAEETVDDAVAVILAARQAGRRAQVTLSVAFGCPFDGEVPLGRVVDFARRLAQAGPVEIAFGDTIGVATPYDVRRLVERVRAAIPSMPLRMHFHDTRGTAIANVWEATTLGIATIDASIGGCGGCPFAPGASGNVATEDVLFMFDRSSVSTGLNRKTLEQIVPWLQSKIGRSLPGRQSKVRPFPEIQED